MERKALVALAKELNKVMGLEPRIKTNQKKDKIEEQIFQAIDLITDDDVFSEEAETMIRILLKKSGEPEEVQQGEEPEPEGEEDIGTDTETETEGEEDIETDTETEDEETEDEETEDEAEELNEDEVEIEEAEEPEEVGIEEAEETNEDKPEEAGIEEPEEAEKDETHPVKSPEGEIKAEKKTKTKTKIKKKGVIQTIVDVIENSKEKGATKDEILKVLVKTFPERNPNSMKNTINIQVPNRISKERFIVEKVNNRFRKKEEK